MPEEKKPRIGVYVCHCGGNISDYVDVAEVAKRLGEDPNVVVAKDLMFDCSDASQNEMIDDIKAKNLDRIVCAACSPKLHELTFRGTAKRGGLNPYMYYHANIREQASWAHEGDRKGATEKALAHAKAAVAYVSLAEPLERPRIESTRAVLVIGGGVAGVKAALDLSDMGVQVFLAERSSALGGHVTELGEVYPYGREGPQIVESLVGELRGRENVTVFTNAEVVSYKGYLGQFEAKIRIASQREKEEEITVKVASVIVATGFDSYVPRQGEYGYGVVKGVVTLPELEAMQRKSTGTSLEVDGRKVRDAAFIYCVGSRQKEEAPIEEDRPAPKVNRYCSRFCCNAAVNESMVLGKKYGGMTTYHLYRDMRTYGRNELMYEEAARQGSIFIRFDEDNPPSVYEKDGRCGVTVKSALLENQPVELVVDLVVLVTGMVPRANDGLNGIIPLPIGSDGFYREIHQKLRPVETNIAGLLIAGTSQGPKDIRETLSSASAASAKAASFALKKELELEPFVAAVDTLACGLHQECMKECPYEAIEVREGKARVNTAKCKGCGACVAVCPTEAIQLRGLKNSQVTAMIEAMAG
ncbi:MAG: CoB--CoM heterodisulfide reductase iron-sulfur subunit A family protein [Nitrososphaerota archaeon]|nr:CoB--CoM heterodisulfide reductase iron-sulfur subunit A family protein [Nitrososphaerota archaeon]MDG7023811.1 CoB--CoM heterodisulfide reductase iron-sulfur subunit A family protein [Nitrososphaerota archaeon]